jgi:hypothetical protein
MLPVESKVKCQECGKEKPLEEIVLRTEGAAICVACHKKVVLRSNCPRFQKGKCSSGAYSVQYCGEIPCCDCETRDTCEDDMF